MPKYEKGDYIKVEFSDEATGVAEWMWVRVQSCDDAKQVVFGTLDNAPVNDASGTISRVSGEGQLDRSPEGRFSYAARDSFHCNGGSS